MNHLLSSGGSRGFNTELQRRVREGGYQHWDLTYCSVIDSSLYLTALVTALIPSPRKRTLSVRLTYSLGRNCERNEG